MNTDIKFVQTWQQATEERNFEVENSQKLLMGDVSSCQREEGPGHSGSAQQYMSPTLKWSLLTMFPLIDAVCFAYLQTQDNACL